jgi:hypothetical protein
MEHDYAIEFTAREDGKHINIIYNTAPDGGAGDINNYKPQILVRINRETKEVSVTPYQDYDVNVLNEFAENLRKVMGKGEGEDII